MKLWPVLGALLSLVTGTLPEVSSIEAEESARPDLASTAVGWSIEGEGFVVWDEDRREAEGWASELARAAGARRRSGDSPS